jgi:hypothetical protein
MDPIQPPTNLETEAQPSVPKPDGEEDILDVLQKDFDRLKAQKARPTGGVEGTTLTNLCFLHDEQYVNYRQKGLSLEPQDANKLYLTFNLIAPRFNKLLGRLSAFSAPFKARPNKKDPQAFELGEIVDRMLIALDEKVCESSRMRERLYWMGVGGVAFEHVPWIPNSTIEPNAQFDQGELLFRDLINDQIVPQSVMEQMITAGRPQENFEIYEEIESVGEVGSEILGPLNVFVDQSVRDIASLAPDQWVHIARIRTVGYVKENFDVEVKEQKDVNIIVSKIRAEGEASGGVFLKDLIPMVQGSCDENDPPMVVVVESYQPASKERPHGRYVCWIPGDQILHDEDNPYEEIPIVDFHWSAATTSFWSKAYITPLIAPQRFINKRMSQLGEQANAAIYSSILLAPGMTEADIPADFPGAIINGMTESGIPAVGRLGPPEIPQWFLQSIEMAVKMFNDTALAADLMEDTKFPGQLRGPLAVPMLQEILDTAWGPLFEHLGERLSRVKQMRLNRVKQFYPPIRTMHYTDKTQKDEVMEFHTDQVLKGGTNFSVTVERGSLLPELRALREERVKSRLSGPLAILYMDERTGRLDKSKIAADLQFGDTGREARESQYRKLANEIIKMLWEGRPVAPVQPFYDHVSMLDELEAAMATTEFLKASQPIQQAFGERWAAHQQFLQAEAAAQQAGMQSAMMHSAVAQATQQAAAKAASMAVDQAMEQVQAQKQLPTDQYVAAANGQAGPGAPPPPKKRKLTLEEHG